jgi:WD40 repeat protein/predicted Ser/Thr protein kinase
MGDRTQEIFDEAAALPPDERAAFLQRACGDEPTLRADVESLLACDANLAEGDDEGFLNSPLVRAQEPTHPLPGESPSHPVTLSPRQLVTLSRVGCFRVLRLLGEGGMGAVYEAEQDSPHRLVALKMIRPGLLSPAVLKRFAQEVEILGRLRHPGIAQIYQAGVAEDGQQFFAMEFICGVPLDEYARRRSLTPPARLEVLARVCDAVQHAHDQGVIHRDLKPANILVEESGQPKVLDFGVARARGADLISGSGLTQTGQVLGTPNYMSPEQVTADPAAIDHRTDVYALGIILFELLAGHLPYRLENRPLAEAARLILEQDPPRLGSLNPELRGDLETIVAKALAKDPARRYQSAADLAADLRRWLTHEPILARPPSALYHLRQFASRHKALVVGVAATVAALILGMVGTTLFAIREVRQRGQAEHNANEALFEAYRGRLAAAAAALSAHDVADAAHQLDAAPKELRDWEWRHLQSRLDDSSAMIPWAAKNTGLLEASPDGLQAWAVTDAGLRLTDLENYRGHREHRDKTIHLSVSSVSTVVRTRRGLRIAAWVGDRALDLLNEAGQVLCHVEAPPTREPSSVAVRPDGAQLMLTQTDGEWRRLHVFDATSGKQTAICAGHYSTIYGFSFSPDGARLASVGEDKLARIWDTATGALLATCRGHTSKVLGVAFRPDGARLVTTSADGTVRQWDTVTGREVEGPYERHSDEVNVAVYSPDGECIASAGMDRTIRVWQATGRQDVAVLYGHTGAVTGLAFAPDGNRLASLSRELVIGWGDETMRIWEVDPHSTLPVLRGHASYVYPVACSPDGRWIASGGWDNTARLWDAATGEPIGRPLSHPGFVLSLAFAHEGRWLVTGSFGNKWLRIWDVGTGRPRKKIPGPGRLFRRLTVSPDGARVAATRDGDQQAWRRFTVCDISSGEPLFEGPGDPLAYSPDGRWLAVVDADQKTVLLLDARTHETAARFEGHKNLVWSGAFSPDSRRLASCSQDRTVRLWQINPLPPSPRGQGGVRRVTECQELRGHTDEVFAAAFHPDGTRLATAGRDRAIWLWDLNRGEEVARLTGHTSYIWSLAFSPDGKTLVSGSGDSTVRLWDTAPLRTRYQARREAAALRPDAERLVEQLWRQKTNPDEVVETLRADRALSEPLRHAALREVMRRTLPAENPPGN